MKTTLKKRISAGISIIIFSAALAACGSGGSDSSGPLPTAQIALASNAMGGAAALQAVQSQTITASGQRFEAEQTFTPGDPPRNVSDFQVTLSQDLANNRLRFDWQWNVVYPFAAQLQFADVTDGGIGFVDGQDGSGAVQAAMPSVRVAVMGKLHRLTSPLVLMRTANANPEAVTALPDEAFQGKLHRVIAIPNPVSPIRVFIDPDSGLPAKADTREDDPYYGDTLFEAIFADWRQVGEIMMPFGLTIRLQGITFHTETRSAIQNNPALAANAFTIPAALQTAFDAADAVRGERRSQWFFRRQALGLPGYADQSLSVVFTQIAPGVFHVTGGSHHSMIVDMGDHLIAVEAPLDEARSQAVIARAKALIPGKPIRFIVNTHFHLDHGGGIRAYAAEGATLVVGEAGRQRFQDILLAPHTLVPDALQLNPRAPAIQTVSTTAPVILNGTTRNLEVYPVANSHSAAMVIAYLPQEGIAFVSDLFNPAGDFTLAALPADLTATFTRFGLTVTRIAGGHGTVGALIP